MSNVQERGMFHMLNKSFKAQPLAWLLQRTVGQCEGFVELRAQCSAVVVVMKSECAPFFSFFSMHTKTQAPYKTVKLSQHPELYCTGVTLPQNVAEKLKTTFKKRARFLSCRSKKQRFTIELHKFYYSHLTRIKL